MEIHTDFLVLGTGIAGLSFAIKAAELGSVAMVTKKDKTDSNTNLRYADLRRRTLERRGRPFRGDGGTGEAPRIGAMGRGIHPLGGGAGAVRSRP
jgi:flavin-dependent dehydrogenase